MAQQQTHPVEAVPASKQRSSSLGGMLFLQQRSGSHEHDTAPENSNKQYVNINDRIICSSSEKSWKTKLCSREDARTLRAMISSESTRTRLAGPYPLLDDSTAMAMSRPLRRQQPDPTEQDDME